MERFKQEQPKKFPEWVRQPEYLPSIEELNSLQSDGLWDDFVHHNPLGSQFQILTKEFVHSLAGQILAAIEKLPENVVNILEVGAGNGRLTYFLEKEIKDKVPNKEIILKATDDFSWDGQIGASLGSPFMIKKLFNVEETSVVDALKSNPDIVLASWMPKETDWTKNFKENLNIKTFILIGDKNECGTEASWSPDENFQRVDLPVNGNVCWSDLKPGYNSHSSVAVFSRK